ncbi:Hypothetical protein ORPV_339 [Orpheovirus IHUMI-LCC2]|uniref:Uncharacterized protein n=1 Tax=Orpheovirus IHUMI-LCC2 TaxID=2023057 RepID=A0A2I2L3Z1_9VIRU|nr:Hypothetical protein ORPV_339 [Orpheovirus IHUMI-LCC2]SNW62243.1 Hypothetical protein ORPV_339 [Orpheovirus IHUMI-LCC2]
MDLLYKDCKKEIVKHIDKNATLGILKQVSKEWNHIIGNDKIRRCNDNDKLILLNLYPNLPWHYNILSSKKIPINFIKKHMDKKWDMKRLYFNHIIDINFIIYLQKNYSDKIVINYDCVLQNPNIRIEDLKYIPKINYTYLSKNPNLTMEYILNNLDKKWNWGYICENFNINDILDNINILSSKINMKILSRRTDITEDILEKFYYLDWEYGSLSRNKNISMKFVQTHINKAWDIDKILKKSDITVEFIKEHKNRIQSSMYDGNYSLEVLFLLLNTMKHLSEYEKGYLIREIMNKATLQDIRNCPYTIDPEYIYSNIKIDDFTDINDCYYKWLSINKNVGLDIIVKYRYKSWDWIKIHKRFGYSISWDDVERYISNTNIPFNLNKICRACPMRIIDNNLQLPWNWDIISERSLSVEELEEYVDKINLDIYVCNNIEQYKFLSKYCKPKCNWLIISFWITEKEIEDNIDIIKLLDFDEICKSNRVSFDWLYNHLNVYNINIRSLLKRNDIKWDLMVHIIEEYQMCINWELFSSGFK